LGLLVLMAMVLIPSSASANGALSLVNLYLDTQDGHIRLNFGLGVEGNGEMTTALQDGATLKLGCKVHLIRTRGFWFDDTLAEAGYESFVSQDALTGEFLLKVPGQEDPLRGEDLKGLLKKGWGAITLDLGAVAALKRGQEYRLELTTSLKHADVPAWLNYALFFWSWDVFPEDHYTLEFKH